jgi:hypothetical protein
MNRSALRVSAVGGALSGLAGSTLAALPSVATELFTSVATDGALVIAAAFTAAVAITGGWIVFDMVKRGARKAAK